MIQPSDIVEYNGEEFVVVDVADYREEDDGGLQDVFAALRANLPEGDPERKLNPDGSDVILDAQPVSNLRKVGRIQ